MSRRVGDSLLTTAAWGAILLAPFYWNALPFFDLPSWYSKELIGIVYVVGAVLVLVIGAVGGLVGMWMFAAQRIPRSGLLWGWVPGLAVAVFLAPVAAILWPILLAATPVSISIIMDRSERLEY